MIKVLRQVLVFGAIPLYLCVVLTGAGISFLISRLKGTTPQLTPPKKTQSPTHPLSREELLDYAAGAVQRHIATYGIVGLTVGVSVDGETVWQRGFGLANVELAHNCQVVTVMRIGSISKAITSVLAGKLVDAGKLDLDRPIQDYLFSDFPQKFFNGKPVTITSRQLLSHTGGIRHYRKGEGNKPVDLIKEPEACSADSTATEGETKSRLNTDIFPDRNRKYASVAEAVAEFRDDDLVAEPGTEHHYSTFGYTLLSAVLESAAGGRVFNEMIEELFSELGMVSTRVDRNEPIVPYRASYYRRNRETGELENVPQVDCSYKVAGGGIVSNVPDLLKLANELLYCYQQQQEGGR